VTRDRDVLFTAVLFTAVLTGDSAVDGVDVTTALRSGVEDPGTGSVFVPAGVVVGLIASNTSLPLLSRRSRIPEELELLSDRSNLLFRSCASAELSAASIDRKAAGRRVVDRVLQSVVGR